MIAREQIVAAARARSGTPYHHQASCRGAGADCLGLVRGVWREIHGRDAELPPYDEALLARELQVLIWGGDPASCAFPDIWRKVA